MKSKTKILNQIKKKTNTNLVETVKIASKNKNWIKIAEILSRSRRKRIDMNLEEINKNVEEDKILVVPGKILSQGEIDKKIKIVGLNFSEKAREKLLKTKCEISSIKEEIQKNPEAKGVKILK